MICPKCFAKVADGATQCSCGFAGSAPPAPPLPPPQPLAPETPAEPAGRQARMLSLLGGAVMLAAGIILTIQSHTDAVKEGSRSYTLFTGLMIAGVVGIARAFASDTR